MNQLLFDRALFALRELLVVTPSDQVLVVDDGSLSRRLLDAITSASWALGAETVCLNYRPRHFISMKDFSIFACASRYADQDLIPASLHEAMTASSVVILLNSDLELLFDPRWSILASGPHRIAHMPFMTEDSFLRLIPDNLAEADEIYAQSIRVSEAIRGAGSVLVESAAGTQLRMELGDHRVNVGTFFGRNGRGTHGRSLWPGGQVATVPNAGTAEGVLIIDRSVGGPEFRALREPIRFRIEQGYVVNIEGGHEADLIDRFLASRGDGGEAYHLTELGVGTNPRCRLTGVAAPAEDTHTLGCVSLALGADVHIGGTTTAGCHVDMTMLRASVIVDDECIIEDGAIKLG